MKRRVLLVLLALNVLMELGGGGAMLLSPASMVPDMLHMTLTADVTRAVAIVGTCTLAFALVGGWALFALSRNKPEGYTLALIQALMLIVVGALMAATGTSVGWIDAGKGVVLAAAALWARPASG
jgi:hypothetical protein